MIPTLVFFGYAALILIWIPLGGVLAVTGLMSPFLQATLAVTILQLVQAPPVVLILISWALYLNAILAQSQAQCEGLDQSSGAIYYTEPSEGLEIPSLMKIKAFVIIGMLLIPLPGMPFHLTGLWCLPLYMILTLLSGDHELPSAPTLITWSLLEFGALWIVFHLAQPHTGSIALIAIAACGVPSLLMPQPLPRSHDPNEGIYCSLPAVILSTGLAILMPGQGYCAIGAAVHGKASRVILLGLLEAAVEAYSLQGILRGYSIQKSPFSEVLHSIDTESTLRFVGDFSYGRPVLLMILGVTVLITTLRVWMKPCEAPASAEGMAFGLLVQLFCIAGLWGIPALAVGFCFQFARVNFCQGLRTGHGLAFLAIQS